MEWDLAHSVRLRRYVQAQRINTSIFKVCGALLLLDIHNCAGISSSESKIVNRKKVVLASHYSLIQAGAAWLDT